MMWRMAANALMAHKILWSDDKPFVTSVRMLGSCRHCLTDYEATVCFEEGKACSAKITLYHQLGNLHSHPSWKWVNTFRCSDRRSLHNTTYI